MPIKTKIVILGSGFAGAYCTQALEKELRGIDAEALLMDRNNYFIFYPLLVEAGTGSLEPRHAVVSIRNFIKTTSFRMAEIVGLDTENCQVFYRMKEDSDILLLSYDHLVVALGSVTNLPDIPGLRQYGYEMKSLSNAVALRDRAIQMLEQADATADIHKRHALLHFIVVGGNFTGVEVAGEFHVFLREASRFYKNVRAGECKVTLIELSDRILPILDRDLSGYALQQMMSRDISIRLETTIQQVTKDHVTLNNGEMLSTHTVVWCAGIAPNLLIKSLSFPLDKRGYILCESDLRVQGYENVWAIGDCAVNIDQEGKPYPATAQHAVGQALHLAKNLGRVLKGQPATPCNLPQRGSLAPIGCRTAVAKVMGFKLAGFAAWFLWRSVYLFKMPGWTRRLRVALDWTMDLLFSRDYVELGVHRIDPKYSEIKKKYEV